MPPSMSVGVADTGKSMTLPQGHVSLFYLCNEASTLFHLFVLGYAVHDAHDPVARIGLKSKFKFGLILCRVR